MAFLAEQALRRFNLYRPLFWITGLLLAVSATRIIFETRNYYFFSDDFLNFIVTRQLGLHWPLLVRDWFGELIPLYGVVHWLYLKLFGVVFWPFRAMLVVFQWSVILLTARFGRQRGVHPAILVPALAIIALSPIYGSSYQWYSAALQVLGEGLTGLAAIYLFAVPGKLSPSRYLSGSLLYGIGMCLFPKGLFAAALLFGVRWFVAAGPGVAQGTAIISALKDVSLIVIMAAAYTAGVVFGHYRSGVPLPGMLLTLQYIWAGWNTGFLVGVLGLDHPFPGRLVLVNLFAIGIVATSIWRNPRAAALWISFGIYFLITMTIIAINRATTFQLESADTQRYYPDMLCFLVGYTLISFAHDPGSAQRVFAPLRFVPLVVATALCCAFWLDASTRVAYLWDRPKRNEIFVQNMKEAIRRTGPSAKIANTTVPEWVMPQWIGELTHYQYFMSIFPKRGQAVPLAEADYRFTDEGILVPAKGK